MRCRGEAAPTCAARTLNIVEADSGEVVAIARELFREYADALGVDLSFQDFESELADLPGAYARPSGRLLVALEGPIAAGCVALRDLAGGACELKRLYVRPSFRGRGLGRRLTEAAIAEARALYSALGFREIEPYRFNPIEGTTFMELKVVPPPE